jgi:tetratricopeptide (TPR) repeat protein
MPGKIFVNYRRDDERSTAARIRDRLASTFGDANIFMDVDNLLPGQRFDRELEKALGETDVFLAVIGPRWQELLTERRASGEHDYVREEIAAALQRDMLVIPVLIEQTPLPRHAALPGDMRDLVLHQKHVVSHERFGRDLAELVEAIQFARAEEDRGGKAIEIDPKDPIAYNNRGHAHLKKGYYDRAIADFSKAIEIDPKVAIAYYNRGRTYEKLDYDRAIADFSKAIEIDPHYAAAYNSRGGTYRDEKLDYDRAIADFSKAIEIDPHHATTYVSRGWTYWAMRDYDRAIADFSKAIEIDPHYAVAYDSRGAIYWAMRDYDRAIADFSKVIEIDPHYAAAYNSRGRAYEDQGRRAEAMRDFCQALKISPDHQLSRDALKRLGA